jgi:hypothetical protein
MQDVIPGRVKRERQMCNSTSENLEIPGSRFARPGMTVMFNPVVFVCGGR